MTRLTVASFFGAVTALVLLMPLVRGRRDSHTQDSRQGSGKWSVTERRMQWRAAYGADELCYFAGSTEISSASVQVMSSWSPTLSVSKTFLSATLRL